VEEIMAHKNSGGVGTIVLLVVVSFFVMAWSVNNPSEAKEFVESCVATGKEAATTVGNYLDDKLSSKPSE
tara:strand:- start:1587 stop:1796 length:210 start_codon:yes stop_codon:yes gene_type:complete